MKQTVLVTGSNGLLGQKLTKQLASDPGTDLVATGRGADRNSLSRGYRYASMDITNEEMVRKVLEEFRPNVVIHTAAMTQVDDCEKQQELCELMNVRAVEYIARASEAIGAHLVHLSTDFIFDGSHGPLSEEEKPAPLSIYGDSKRRSEEAVRELSSSWSILRTGPCLWLGRGNEQEQYRPLGKEFARGGYAHPRGERSVPNTDFGRGSGTSLHPGREAEGSGRLSHQR
jgi:dTDP-4-dehydrorhamnose reductase